MTAAVVFDSLVTEWGLWHFTYVGDAQFKNADLGVLEVQTNSSQSRFYFNTAVQLFSAKLMPL